MASWMQIGVIVGTTVALLLLSSFSLDQGPKNEERPSSGQKIVLEILCIKKKISILVEISIQNLLRN
jgi:hypothetical protein